MRDAVDAWGEAAVWAELLGPEAAARIVPDVAERTYLRRLRPGMPPGGTGAHAVRAVVEAVVVAGHPDEVADARDRLAEALTRARAERPAPCPGRSAPAHPQAPAGAERRRRGWRALFTRPAGPPGGRCAGGCDAARV